MKLTRWSLLFLYLALVRCGGGDNDLPDAFVDDFDRRALLVNIGENIVLPTYEAFVANTQALAGAVDEYCAALGTADETDRLSAAQSAWSAAMDTWQQAEILLFGPASFNNSDIRDHIYSWPIVSPCAVDQDVMLHFSDPGSYDISTRLTNRRGLDALEYVLFSADLATVCPPQIEPVGWAALADSEKRTARCNFAALAAADLAGYAQSALAAWQPEGGGFLGDFTAAGEAGSSFESPQQAVQAVFSAMFYVDIRTKDLKLAAPLGISANSCGAVDAACPADLESQYAHRSRENILDNLVLFRRLFLGENEAGANGIGFDDFLTARRGAALAASLEAAIDAAITAVDGIPGTLADTLSSDYPRVRGAHDAVKAVTDPLKTDVAATLELMVPVEAGGDTD